MYPLIVTPTFASKEFFSFTKEEAKEYLKWFLSIKEKRIKILEDHVHQLYPYWESNYTRSSLIELYDWFKHRVVYRTTTKEEKEAVKKQLSVTPLLVDVIPIPETTFTEQTVAISFDAGLYLVKL